MPFQQLKQYRNVTDYYSRPFPGLAADEYACPEESYCSYDGTPACYPTPDRNVGRFLPAMYGDNTQICKLVPNQ